MSYTFNLDAKQAFDTANKLADRIGDIGEEAGRAERQASKLAKAMLLKGVSSELGKIHTQMGKWAAVMDRAAPTSKKLVDSMKNYDKELVKVTEQVDRANAATKAHIEINRHKIKETIKYSAELKKLRISERAFSAEQERQVNLARTRLALKKQLSAAETALNPSATVKSLSEQNALSQEQLRIQKELISAKAKQAALYDNETKTQIAETERLTEAMRVESETRKKLYNIKARMKNLNHEVELMRETAALKKLTAQERLNLDQKQRLAAAQIKNSAEYIKTEKAIARLESRYRMATQTISHFNAVHSKGGVIVSTFRNVLDAMGRHIAVYTAGMVGVAAAVYGTTRALRAGFSAFDKYTEAMARVNAVSGAVGTDMRRIDEEVRRLGRTTRFTAVEAAEGMVQLTMAGLSVNEAISALQPTLQLTSIGAMDFGEAADIVTNIMRGFALEAADLPHVIDVMATSVTNSNMTVQQLGNAMSYVAPVAESFGVSLEQVSASMEVLHNSGIKASRAGTGMRRTLLNLYTPTTKGAEALERMAVSTTTFSGKARSFIEILKDMNKAYAEGRASIDDFKQIVGVRASNAFMQLIKGSDDSVTSIEALVDRLHSATGAADAMQTKIEGFIGADWQKLISAVTDVGIGLLKLFEIPIRNWIIGLTNGISALAANEEKVKAFADSLVNIGKGVLFAGQMFITYKLAQTIFSIGTNSAATAQYIATLGTRFLEMAGMVKGWTASIISGQAAVASGAVSSAGIVDSSGKLMQASNAKTAASAITAGNAFKVMGAGILSSMKLVGKFASGFGIVVAAVWAASEAIGWLMNQFFDLDKSIVTVSGTFDTLTESIGGAERRLKAYKEEASKIVVGDDIERINSLARSLEAQAKAKEKLKSESAVYSKLLEEKIALENKEIELASRGTAVDDARAEAIRAKITNVSALMDLSSKSMESFNKEEVSSGLKVIDQKLISVTSSINRYEKQMSGLIELNAEAAPSNTILGRSFAVVAGALDSARERFKELMKIKADLLGLKPGIEAPDAAGDLGRQAEEAAEKIAQIKKEIDRGTTSSGQRLQEILRGIAKLTAGELPDGINTTAKAQQWLAKATADFENVYRGVVKEGESYVKLLDKTKTAAEQFNAAHNLSAVQSLTELERIRSEGLEEYISLETRRAAGEALTTKELNKQLAVISKVNKAETAIAKLKRKAESDRKEANKQILASISLGKEYVGELNLTDEELRKVAASFENSVGAMGEYRVEQELINRLVERFPEYAKDAERHLRNLAMAAEMAGKSEFEKTLIGWKDVIGDLDKASAGWVKGFSDALGDFIVDGKADFRGFVDSILRDLAKLAAQQIVIKISGSFDGISGGTGDLMGSLFGGGTSSGGSFGGIGDMFNAGKSVFNGISGLFGSSSLVSVGASAPAGGMMGWLGHSGAATLANTAGTTAIAGGGAGSMVGATTASGGLMSSIGAALPYIGLALGALQLLGVFDDQESASKFKLTPGREPNYSDKKRPWKKEDWGASHYGKNGELIGASVTTPFGSVGFGGSGFGKDEQLSDADREQYVEAMISLFNSVSEIDQAIIDAYKFSDDAISRITEINNDMDKLSKEWKAPDIGDYLVGRYENIFSEIGGLAEKLFSDMTYAGMEAEDAIRAVSAALSLDTTLSGLETIAEDSKTIWDEINRTQTEVLNDQLDGILDLADAYDGSISSAEQLAAALESQRQGTISLMIEIEKVRASMTDAFAGTREKIITSTMDDEQKFNYYQKQLDMWAGILANSTDYEQIMSAQEKINELVGKQWDFQLAAGPDAAGQAQQSWLDYLAEQEKVANEQLDKAAKAEEEKLQNLHGTIADSLAEAVVPMTDAAETTESAASSLNEAAQVIFGAGTSMTQAGEKMIYAADRFSGTSISIDLTGGEGFAVGAG